MTRIKKGSSLQVINKKTAAAICISALLLTGGSIAAAEDLSEHAEAAEYAANTEYAEDAEYAADAEDGAAPDLFAEDLFEESIEAGTEGFFADDPPEEADSALSDEVWENADGLIEDFSEENDGEAAFMSASTEAGNVYLHNVTVVGPDGKKTKTYAMLEDAGLCSSFEEGCAVWLYADGVLTIEPWDDSDPAQMTRTNDWSFVTDNEDGLTPPWMQYADRIREVRLDPAGSAGLYIGSCAFANMPVLSTVSWEENVGITLGMGDYAFYHDADLETVSDFFNVTQLGKYAFSGCTSLGRVVFAYNVPEANEGVFAGFGQDQVIIAPDQFADEVRSMCMDGDGNISADLQLMPSACGTVAYWSLDTDGTLYITGSGPMYNFNAGDAADGETYLSCDAPWSYAAGFIRQIDIQDGITEIGDYAFSSCTNWDGIVALPASVVSAGTHAFDGAPALRITFFGPVPVMGRECFIWSDQIRFAVPPDYGFYDLQQRDADFFFHNLLADDTNTHLFEAFIYPPEGGEAMDPYHRDRWIYAADDYRCGISGAEENYEGTGVWELRLDGTMIISGNDSVECAWGDEYKPLIRKVETGEGIRYLADRTFEGCENLTYVQTYVENMGDDVFRGCYRLERVGLLSGSGCLDDGRDMLAELSPDYRQLVRILFVYPRTQTIDFTKGVFAVSALDLSRFYGCPSLQSIRIYGNTQLSVPAEDEERDDLQSLLHFSIEIYGTEGSRAAVFCRQHRLNYSIIGPEDIDQRDNYEYLPLTREMSGRAESSLETLELTREIQITLWINDPNSTWANDYYRDEFFYYTAQENGDHQFYLIYDDPLTDQEPFRAFTPDGTGDDPDETARQLASSSFEDVYIGTENRVRKVQALTLTLTSGQTVYFYHKYPVSVSFRFGVRRPQEETEAELTVSGAAYNSGSDYYVRPDAHISLSISNVYGQPQFLWDSEVIDTDVIYETDEAGNLEQAEWGNADHYDIPSARESRIVICRFYKEMAYDPDDNTSRLSDIHTARCRVCLMNDEKDQAAQLTEYEDSTSFPGYRALSWTGTENGQAWFRFVPENTGEYSAQIFCNGGSDAAGDPDPGSGAGTMTVRILDKEGVPAALSDGSMETVHVISENGSGVTLSAHLEAGQEYYYLFENRSSISPCSVCLRIAFSVQDKINSYSYAFPNSRASFGYTDGVRNFDYEPYRRIFDNTTFAQSCFRDWGDRQWSGNCFGMSATACLMNVESSGLTPSFFNESASVSDLYLGYADSSSGLTVQEFIEMMQVGQFWPAIQQTLESNEDNMEGLVQAMKEAQVVGEPLIIAMYGGMGGHAVVGLGLTGNDKTLLVYDSNTPMQQSRISLKSAASAAHPWNHISFIPYSLIEQLWKDRSNVENDGLGYMCTRRSDVLSVYCGDTLIGRMIGGEFIRSSQCPADVFEMVFMDGPSVDEEIAYICVPMDNEYRIEKEGGRLEVSLINEGRAVTVSTQAGAVSLKADDNLDTCYARIEGQEKETYSVQISEGSAGEGQPKEVLLEGESISKNTIVLEVSGGSVRTENADGAMLTENGKTRRLPSSKDQAASKQKAFISVNAKTVKLKKGQATSGLIVSMADWDSVKSVKAAKKGIVKASVKNAKKGVIKLKGKKTGSSKVTITLKSGLSAVIKVKVQKGRVVTKGLTVTAAETAGKAAGTLNGSKLTLRKGQKFRLKTGLKPFTSQDKVTYRSSKPEIAGVSEKGVVKAKKAGKAKITIRAGKKKKVLKVEVKP